MEVLKYPLAVVLAVGITCAIGCGESRPATHPVVGQVQYSDGTFPMFGDVEFYNRDLKLNARGKIQRDGAFTVGTFEDDDGAVAGKHQIVIIQRTRNHLTAEIEGRINHDHGELINKKYFDYRTSGLEATIEPGENQVSLTIDKIAKHQEKDVD